MFACVLWIDSEHAKIFKITEAGVTRSQMKNHHHPHSNSHGAKREHNEEEHFFHEIAKELEKAEELLVVGPGLAKTHFKTHLEKHHHHQLAKHVVGVETVDSRLTDNQILEFARKFFKVYNQYHSSI